MPRKKSKTNKSMMQSFGGKKGGVSMMTAGAVGAVVGGALGAAGAIILADQNKRSMITQRAYKLKDYATDTFNHYSTKASENGNMLAGMKNGKRVRSIKSRLKH